LAAVIHSRNLPFRNPACARFRLRVHKYS
jgi:hypothetical protein